MKLWELLAIDGPLWKCPYDKAHAFVIRAKDESTARVIAGENAGDEDAWLNPDNSTCSELLPDGPAEVILVDFAAG